MSLDVGNYHCSKPTCPFKNYVEGTDYGYYSKTNGDCESCRRKCNDDENCGAVECGRSICSWWRNGICNTDSERTWNRKNKNNGIKTCIKRKLSKNCLDVRRD